MFRKCRFCHFSSVIIQICSKFSKINQLGVGCGRAGLGKELNEAVTKKIKSMHGIPLHAAILVQRGGTIKTCGRSSIH